MSKLPRKEYEEELRKLQTELCHLQTWVKHKGLRIVIVFEGRDGAGKQAGRLEPLPNGSAPVSFELSPYRLPPTVRRAKCTYSVTCRTSPLLVKSSSSTAAGTTGPASNTYWGFARHRAPSVP